MIKKTKRKAFNFLRSYFDVLNELTNDKDKLDFLTAIINKQFLNEDPIELNFIVNLCYESQRHQIETSVKGWLRATKEELSPTLPTTPMTTLPTTPMTDVKEEEEEEKEEVKDKVKRFDFKKSCISFGFDAKLIDEWLLVRKNKKLTNSETAFKNFILEIEKTEADKNEILEQCVVKSWGGFKAEWYTKENNVSLAPIKNDYKSYFE